MDLDFFCKDNNLEKFYAQISHTLKFWNFPVFAYFEYSGDMGFVNDTFNGFPIINTYSLGAAYPFQWKGGWFSDYLSYRYVNFTKPSHDIINILW